MVALLCFALSLLASPFKSKSKFTQGHSKDLIWVNVTASPTAEWIARQVTEAFPWDDAPQYLIRDRDRI